MDKAGKSFSVIVAVALVLSLAMTAALCLPQPVNAAEFHVTTAAEFQDALNNASNNGEDDTIYLAAGTYEGNFVYAPGDGKPLIIKGEAGTTAQDVILDGGGDGRVLDLSGSSEGGSVSIEGVTLQNGSGGGTGGNGLYVWCENASLDITLDRVLIQYNSTEYAGGGIRLGTYENGAIHMKVCDSVIRYNQSRGSSTGGQGWGGGIFARSCEGNSTIDLLIVNSLIYENQANGNGAGIDIWACEVGDNNVTRAVVINSTITDNVANMHGTTGSRFGGIRVCASAGNGAIASLDLYNTILYGNTALGGEAGEDLFVTRAEPGSARADAYYSDIEDVHCFGTASYNPVNVISADPAFVDPASGDYHLSAGSPCIDTGTATVPDPPGLPATDIESNPRVWGAAPDMGAYEAWDPWVYDVNPKDGIIQKMEAIQAVIDYFDGVITKMQAIEVVMLYFT